MSLEQSAGLHSLHSHIFIIGYYLLQEYYFCCVLLCVLHIEPFFLPVDPSTSSAPGVRADSSILPPIDRYKLCSQNHDRDTTYSIVPGNALSTE